jgi:hypothetical protein
MTITDFRRMALGMDGAVESAHMGHPDFRANGRVFASLGYPDRKWACVMLSPDHQRARVAEHEALTPVKGAWGAQGATQVRLDAVDEETLGVVMTLAWQHAMAKPPARQKKTARPRAASARTKSPAPARPRRRT